MVIQPGRIRQPHFLTDSMSPTSISTLSLDSIDLFMRFDSLGDQISRTLRESENKIPETLCSHSLLAWSSHPASYELLNTGSEDTSGVLHGRVKDEGR